MQCDEEVHNVLQNCITICYAHELCDCSCLKNNFSNATFSSQKAQGAHVLKATWAQASVQERASMCMGKQQACSKWSGEIRSEHISRTSLFILFILFILFNNSPTSIAMAKALRLQTWVLNCTSALKRTVSTPTSSVLRRDPVCILYALTYSTGFTESAVLALKGWLDSEVSSKVV